jgi:hypothetical protein
VSIARWAGSGLLGVWYGGCTRSFVRWGVWVSVISNGKDQKLNSSEPVCFAERFCDFFRVRCSNLGFQVSDRKLYLIDLHAHPVFCCSEPELHSLTQKFSWLSDMGLPRTDEIF